jgi:hypothetical protein
MRVSSKGSDNVAILPMFSGIVYLRRVNLNPVHSRAIGQASASGISGRQFAVGTGVRSIRPSFRRSHQDDGHRNPADLALRARQRLDLRRQQACDRSALQASEGAGGQRR